MSIVISGRNNDKPRGEVARLPRLFTLLPEEESLLVSSPAVIKKINDAEYTRRYNRLFFMHVLSLLPLLVFAVAIWMKTGGLVWSVAYYAGGSYLLILMCLRVIWRREVLGGMRRENMIDESYRPPRW